MNAIHRTLALAVACGLGITDEACRQFPDARVTTDVERQGREIFRYDAFGD